MRMLENRLVKCGDAALLREYFAKNSKHFKAWEPERPECFYELSYWQEQVAYREEHQILGAAMYWLAVDNETQTILAHCSLTNVVQGVFKAAYMGYAVDELLQGQGLMKTLCLTCISHAFNELKLNRIMANHMPHNYRSEALLAKLGFEREGMAKKYLKINGRWEDHVLNALVNPAAV